MRRALRGNAGVLTGLVLARAAWLRCLPKAIYGFRPISPVCSGARAETGPAKRSARKERIDANHAKETTKMRRALVAVAAAVLVVAVTGGLTMTGGTTGRAREHAVAADLDKLHAVRPVAAHRRPTRPAGPSGTDALPATQVSDVMRARIIRYVAAVQDAQTWAFLTDLNRLLTALAPEPKQVRHARRVTRATQSSGGGDFLACVRHRESRGQYNAVNGSSGAAGAYQFMPTTWNNAARDAGRGDLVGVNPAAASPADQDAMARYVYSTQGARPWGGGCH
jgi:Transglycosylase-like domain